MSGVISGHSSRTTTVDYPQHYENFIGELNELCEEIYPYITDHHQLTTNLKRLQVAAADVADWAIDYDHNNLQANGYWSAIRIGVNLGRLVKEKYTYVKETENPQIEIDQNLVLLTDYFTVAIDVLQKLRNDSVANGLQLQASSVSYFTELFGVLLTLDEKMVAAMYGKYCGFWLCRGSRNIMVTCVTAFSVLADGLTNVLKCVFNSEYRGLVLAKLIKSADISFLKRLGFLMELPLYTKLLPYLLYGNSPQMRRELRIERQREWCLTHLHKKVSRTVDNRHHRYDRNSRSVRCKLIRAQGSHRDCLVFHCHGGGFVMGSPESNEVYLRDWANRLEGIPIISVDYTVSPKAKFPTALQEILDVYLWLTSRKHKVKQTLGFHPKHIVLVGDSAGGNLISALCMVLNDIRTHKHHPLDVVMPKSLVCVYTPFNLTLKLSPSMILASCDGFISAGVMLSCFEAYLPDVSIADSSESLTKFSFVSFGDYKVQVYENVKRLLSFLRSLTDFTKYRKSWYLEDRHILEPKVERLYQLTSNPYVSPLCYDNFDSLSNVSINLIALHYDPFLDDNVTMAHQWKGPVKLDVLDGLQHGFLNIMPFVEDAKKGCDLVLRRIRESFEQI